MFNLCTVKGKAFGTCELLATGRVFLEHRTQCRNILKEISHAATISFVTYNFGNVDIFPLISGIQQ